jgi:hypothetical protein
VFAYWSRILGAWLLLRFASAVIRDAEKVLHQAMRPTPVKITDPANGKSMTVTDVPLANRRDVVPS